MTLTVRVWPAEIDGGFIGQCVEIPGAMSQGETEVEAYSNTLDAIQEMLLSMTRDASEAARRRPEPARVHHRPVRVAIGT